MEISIPFCRPVILPEDIRSACRAMTGKDIAGGRYVKMLEEECAKRFSGHWCAVSSGTAGLRICAMITAPLTRDKFTYLPWSFHATSEAIDGYFTFARMEQVYVAEDNRWRLTIPDAPANVISVSLGGIGMDTNGRALFADDCQSFGLFPPGPPRSVFSFSASKIVTCGHGGIIRFENPKEADQARRIRNHCKVPGKEYVHDEIGFNYMLTDYAAALVTSQLNRLQYLVGDRWDSSQRLKTKIAMEGVYGPTMRMPLFRSIQARDFAQRRCTKAGIETRKPYQGHQMYSDYGLLLPTHILTRKEIDSIAKAVKP